MPEDNQDQLNPELEGLSQETDPVTSEKDTSALRKALESERKSRRQLEKTLKQLESKFTGIDPEKHKELLEAQQQRELTELEAQQQRELTEAEKKQEFQKASQMKQEQIDKLAGENEELKNRYRELKKQNALQRAYFRSKGKDTQDNLTGSSYFQKFYQDFGGRFEFNEDGSLTVLNERGEPAFNKETGKDISVDEYMAMIKNDNFYGRMFEPESSLSGTGTMVNRNGGGTNRPSFEQKMGWKK